MTLVRKVVRVVVSREPVQELLFGVEENWRNSQTYPNELRPTRGPRKLSTLQSSSQDFQKAEHDQNESLWEATADPAFQLKD